MHSLGIWKKNFFVLIRLIYLSSLLGLFSLIIYFSEPDLLKQWETFPPNCNKNIYKVLVGFKVSWGGWVGWTLNWSMRSIKTFLPHGIIRVVSNIFAGVDIALELLLKGTVNVIPSGMIWWSVWRLEKDLSLWTTRRWSWGWRRRGGTGCSLTWSPPAMLFTRRKFSQLFSQEQNNFSCRLS